MKSTPTFDVTAPTRAQQHEKVQFQIAEILAEATSWKQAAPLILRALCEGFGWDLGTLWQVDQAGQTLRPLATWHRAASAPLAAFAETTREYKFSRGEGIPGRVWAEGTPLWLENLMPVVFPRADEAARANFHSAFAFPLSAGGNVVGVLEAFAQQTQPQDQNVLEQAHLVGIQVGHFILRQQNLRDVSRLAAIVHDSEDAILSKDLDGIILDWNPAAERLYGYSRDEIVGQTAALLYPPELVEQQQANLEQIANGESIRHYDTVRVRKDGTRVDVAVTISPIRDETGKVIGASSIARDVSQRHALERAQKFAAIENARLYQEMQTLNEELEARVGQRTYELSEAYKDLSREVVERTRAEETTRALLSLSNKLNSTLDIEASLDILIQDVIQIMGVSSGLAGLRTAQGMRAQKYYTRGRCISFEQVWQYGEGLPGWVWEHGAPYVTNNAPNDPVMLRDLHMNAGVQTAICAPIFDSQNQVICFLYVRDKIGAAPFTDADVEFLMALSPIASIALVNAEAYQKISQAESAVQDSYAQLRALAARLQTIREEERTDIARELHDELGQALTALKMDVAVLKNGLPPRNKKLRERAQNLSDQIDVTIKTVRRISSQLRPGMLDDLGLGPSMEWYAQEFQTRTGILVETNILEQDLALDPAQATALYRIFQETLTNVARHANAARVQAKLELQDEGLRMEIADDGQGFDIEQVRGKRSLGLLGMRERAEMIHGTLEVQSQVGGGTTIIMRLPLGVAESS